MPSRPVIFLTLWISLILGISASAGEHGWWVVVTERLSVSLVKVTDGQGHITGFRYDGLARKTRTIWDEGSSVERIEQASFDGLVQLSRTDPLGRVTTYQYDGLHRLEDVLYAGAATDNRHYDYDLVGNLREVSYPNESPARQLLRGVSQDFDALNRLTEETSAGKTHVHNVYDKAGNRRSTIYAATGRTLVSTYDKLNRLLTLTEGSAVTRYAYDRNGNITRKVHANGTETRCTFDAFNRKLSENTLTATGAVVSAFDYSQAHGGYPSGYDHVGNVRKVVEQYGHANVEDRTVTNLYDRNYRLKTETIVESGGDTTLTGYDYDAANNRTAKTVSVNGGTATVWTFTLGTFAEGYSSNQIKSVEGSPGVPPVVFLYDLNGNRSEKKVGGVTTQTYTYDHENRLIAVVDAVEGSFAYAYDHRTRRVLRDEQGSTGVPPVVTTLSFAGGLSVQEYQGSATTPSVETIRGSDYGGGIGGVLYTIRGSARSHNAYNSRGDVVSQTNESAIITWQAAYEAFGTRTQEEGATLDRQKANTKDEDPTGLLNEGMRYRDLEFGIFLTRDPAGFVDGPNVYTYVRQNPWTKWDPLGLAERVDPDGFKWSDRNHHVVPREVARDSGWCAEAKDIFNNAVIETPRHNNTAHPKYNKEVAAEMAEFVAKWSPSGIGDVSARDQVKMAQDFVEHLSKTKNEYIRGFNGVVGKGPAKVAEWYNETGRNIVLKSTGQLAHRGGKIINGIANLASKGSKMITGIPFLGGAIAGGAALIGGADAAEATAEVIVNSTIIGSVALDLSGLRSVSQLQNRAIEFNDNPEMFLNEDTGNPLADDINGGLNLRKRLYQEDP